jgi:hypothetical protein
LNEVSKATEVFLAAAYPHNRDEPSGEASQFEQSSYNHEYPNPKLYV